MPARPGTAPETLLRAVLLQASYSVRLERQPTEQIGHNLLFRWFVGLAMDAPVWDAISFSKNRRPPAERRRRTAAVGGRGGTAAGNAMISDDDLSVAAR